MPKRDEHPNDKTNKKNDTNDLVIVCDLKIQKSYQPKGKSTTNKTCSTDTSHNTNIRVYTKHLTTHKYVICNNIQTITKQKTHHAINQKTQTSNCANWNFKQYYKKKNDTNDVVIVCKFTMQSSYKKGRQRKIKAFKRNTTQGRTFGTRTNSKHQINNLYVAPYKQKKN